MWKFHRCVLIALAGLALSCSDAPDSGIAASADSGGIAGGDGVRFGGSDGFVTTTDGATAGADTSARGNPRGKCDFAADPAPGEAGAPCVEPADCDTGYCVASADGKVCSRKCVECCPQGYVCRENEQGDAEFICKPRLAALCRPCVADSECAALSDDALCVWYGTDGSFCGGACAEDKDCEVGYACEDATGSQGSGKQCVRKVGQCGCSPKSITEGAAALCATKNTQGVCQGKRVCTASGLGACDAPAAQAEQCNGLDDDCDGQTDEDAGGADCQVTNGFGSCPGKTVCQGGQPVCQGLDPKAEACNGQDDDCDGATDEGFPDTDKDGQADCLDDDQDGDGVPDATDCDPKDGKVFPGAKEVCNGKDDNCDGVTDEKDAAGCKTWYADVDSDNYGDPKKAACLCQPDAVYKVADGNDCNDLAQTIYPTAKELCNGADDNCDGTTDEGFQVGGACEDGKGACKAFGKVVCGVSGTTTACSAKAGAGAAEQCDGIDNDCDGTTDEGFQVNGPCTAGKGQCAVQGTWKCAANGSQAVCDAVIPPGKAEVCDGLDNDCDGQTDEGCDDDKDGYCDANMVYVNGAACSKGKGDCRDDKSAVYPGASEVCDGLDNDCNGKTDSLTKDCSNGCGKGSQTCAKGSWSTCSAPKPKCTSGACCDGCNYRPSSYKCGKSPSATAYQCSGTCGGKVRKIESWRYCTGSSSSCTSGNVKKIDKGITKSCASNQLCKQSGSSATCSTCSSGCVSGKCNTQPKYTICIDPQFGGSSGGACHYGVCTKTLNLDIAKKLESFLNKDTSNGAGGGTWKVVLTRTGDSNPSISNRVATCNNNGSHRVISIAVNAYTSSAAKGIESYYYKGTSKSFCTTLHNEIVARTKFYNRGVKTSGSYSIIKSVSTPYACFPAPGYLSNSADAAKLKDGNFRNEIARAMLYGIQKSFGYSAFNP